MFPYLSAGGKIPPVINHTSQALLKLRSAPSHSAWNMPATTLIPGNEVAGENYGGPFQT